MNETETKKGITDGLGNKIFINNVMSPHVCNVNMNCLALPNKRSNMETEKMICKNIESDASEIDYNDLAFRKQSQVDLEYDDNSSSEIATKYQFQNLMGEFFYKEKFNSLLDFVVKKESHIDVEYDSLRFEVTPENQYHGLKSVFLDAKEELHSSLDLGIKKENQIDLEFDEWPNYNTTIENQYKDLKKEFLNDKEIHLSSDLLSIETCKFESFNENEKQESKSLNIPNSINSFSETETKKDITNSLANKSSADNVKSLNLGNVNMNCFVVLNKCPNRKNIKVKSLKNFDGSVSYYEVFERTKCGVKTVIFKSLNCPYTTTSKQNIIHHCKAHKRNKNHNCLDCSFSAKCLFLLKRHKKTHLENRFECTICSFSTSSATTLRSHRLYKHIPESSRPKTYRASKLRQRSSLCRTTYNCNMCIFKTRDKYNYQEHKKNHLKRVLKHKKKLKSKQGKRVLETKTIKSKDIAKKNFECEKCTFVTDDMENMSKHKQTHLKSLENDKDFIKDSSEVKLEEPKSRLSQITLSCNSCSFTTPLRIVLLKHKQSHTSSPPGVFKCTECRFSTTKNKLLISHLINHAYKYLYRCIHCNFSSNNKATLKSHKNSHKKPREKTNTRSFRNNKITVSLQAKNNQSFRCFKCDYSCSSEHLLNQHSLIHLESKLLKCAHCDYETNFKGNLVKHVLIHVSEYEDICETTYNCNMCTFRTRDVNSYENHSATCFRRMTKYIEIKTSHSSSSVRVNDDYEIKGSHNRHKQSKIYKSK